MRSFPAFVRNDQSFPADSMDFFGQPHRARSRTGWWIPLFVVVLIGGGWCVYIIHFDRRGGTVTENGIVDSKILGEPMEFSVYLPPDYALHDKSYPVLYLLHGFTGDHTTYPRKIGVKKVADEAIRSGKAVSMIIVMPRSRGGMYENTPNGRHSYEDYFFEELIPVIEKNYRVLKKKESRAISGHSMGGNGALLYALKHPTLFESCCVVGAAIDMNVLETDAPFTGENNLPEQLQHTAEALEAASPEERRSLIVRYDIDCGLEDGLLEVNTRLHVRMQELGITHEFHQRNGGHTWDYWRKTLPFVLEFAFQNLSED